MNTTTEGVTTDNKSYKAKISEVMNEWMDKEKRKRMEIASLTDDLENTICPICGKTIPSKRGHDGNPLVDASVCHECNHRYVRPFRTRTQLLNKKELQEASYRYYMQHLETELMIELTNRFDLFLG